MKKKFLIVLCAAALGLCAALSGCGGDYTKGLIFKEYPDSPGYYSVSGGENKDYTTIKLPSRYESWSVGSIDINAFENCTKLTKINVPDSVTVVGAGAFRGCMALGTIEIPDSVKVIGTESFMSCGLTSITLPKIDEMGSQAFALCTALQSASIGGTVAVLPDRAFMGCFSLTTVALPDSLTDIGRRAFESCSSLDDISFPLGLQTIDSHAFANCAALTSVDFAAVTSIGSFAFLDCTALESVVLPDTLEELQDGAFKGCSALSSVTAHETSVINPFAFDLGADLSEEFALYVPQEVLADYKAAEGWNTIADRIFAIEND